MELAGRFCSGTNAGLQQAYMVSAQTMPIGAQPTSQFNHPPLTSTSLTPAHYRQYALKATAFTRWLDDDEDAAGNGGCEMLLGRSCCGDMSTLSAVWRDLQCLFSSNCAVTFHFSLLGSGTYFTGLMSFDTFTSLRYGIRVFFLT